MSIGSLASALWLVTGEYDEANLTPLECRLFQKFPSLCEGLELHAFMI